MKVTREIKTQDQLRDNAHFQQYKEWLKSESDRFIGSFKVTDDDLSRAGMAALINVLLAELNTRMSNYAQHFTPGDRAGIQKSFLFIFAMIAVVGDENAMFGDDKLVAEQVRAQIDVLMSKCDVSEININRDDEE